MVHSGDRSALTAAVTSDATWHVAVSYASWCNKTTPASPAIEAALSQKYLIFAILSCVPDRQRTLRELELGRTLVKDGDKCGDPLG